MKKYLSLLFSALILSVSYVSAEDTAQEPATENPASEEKNDNKDAAVNEVVVSDGSAETDDEVERK